MSTKILIADDHGVLRAGLHALLAAEPGLEVVGEAETGDEALALTRQLAPDIVLLDISMPGRDGLEVTREVHATCAGTRVLILTASEEKAMLTEALRAGAAGYVVKRALESELILAIQAVMRGDLYVHPSVVRMLLETSVPKAGLAPEQGREPLTPREQEVLVLLAEGLTNAEIAEELMVSRRTVESHRASINSKTGAHNRADLVRYASEHGLLSRRSRPQHDA